MKIMMKDSILKENTIINYERKKQISVKIRLLIYERSSADGNDSNHETNDVTRSGKWKLIAHEKVKENDNQSLANHFPFAIY